MSGVVTASLLPERRVARRPMVGLTCEHCATPFLARVDKKPTPRSCSPSCAGALRRIARSHQRAESADYHHWTAAENDILRRACAIGLSMERVAAEIGVSRVAASLHAQYLGLKHRRLQRTLADRFMDYVSPEPNSGCWLWDGSCDRKGYGQLRISKQVLKPATHVSLQLDGRPVPHGMGACHHCDNPACVNPAHLFIGTQKDNTADMIRKGRGSKPPIAKLGQGRKEFCLRGHLLISAGRYRYCPECRTEWKRARRERFIAMGLRSDGAERRDGR
jgi:hypothetical protein